MKTGNIASCGYKVLSPQCFDGEHDQCGDETGYVCIEHNSPISCKCVCHTKDNNEQQNRQNEVDFWEDNH